MQGIENSRQIPKTKDYIGLGNYYDMLYAHLQIISSWDGVKGHPRFIGKPNFNQWGKEIGICRQTVKKKFDGLIELGLIRAVGDFYELMILDNDIASLVPAETLRLLVGCLKDRVISIYVYLLNRYYATVVNGSKEFNVTYNTLKDFLGISCSTRSNDYIITDGLLVLEKLGLIEYDKVTEEVDGKIKSIVIIKAVYNQIKEC